MDKLEQIFNEWYEEESYEKIIPNEQSDEYYFDIIGKKVKINKSILPDTQISQNEKGIITDIDLYSKYKIKVEWRKGIIKNFVHGR